MTEAIDRSHEMLVLTAVAAAVAQSLELEPLLISALDHVLDLLEMDSGGIWTLLPSQSFRLNVSRGLPSTAAIEPVLGELVASRRTSVMTNFQHAPLADLAAQTNLQALICVPLVARGNSVGALVVLQRRGDGVPPRLLRLLEAIGDYIALALDNARLYAGEQQRHRQSEALRQGALALTEAIGLDAVLGRIADQALVLMEAPMCAVYELTGDGALDLCLARGWPPERTAHRTIRWGGFGVGRAVAEGRTVTYADGAACAADLDLDDSAQLPFHSLIAAPLVVKGQIYGGLAAYYDHPREFSPDEAALLRIFADQAALALEHARLFEQSRQLAALEERQRLARDLHDSVSQTLFSLKLAAQAAQSTLVVDAAATAPLLVTVQELATAALAEMRALIFELRPTALKEAGLPAAIGRQAAVFTARSGVPVTLHIDESRCPDPVEEALYRIVGEALANIARHAHATQVVIDFAVSGGFARLRVQDDGVGFDPTTPTPGDHLGQRTMRERAQALAGSCRVTSGLGRGTRIDVDVPLS